MPREGPKPEFDLVAIGEADISLCRQFVEDQALLGDFTHYAGTSVSKFLHAIGEDGGWLVEENGQLRGIALAPQMANAMVLLPLPMLHRRATHRGIQCLLQSVQLIAALFRLSARDKLAGIAIDFPNDSPPTPQAIRDFGLCGAFPESHDNVIDIPTVRRYVVLPDLLPAVVEGLLEYLGRHIILTEGRAGKAWVVCPPKFSPLREGYRHHLELISAGRLSVIGLPDVPGRRFGNGQ